jgi:hypothetical protein
MTVSDKRSAAARANGALSHGPKTPEGKARSAQNARKHGLLSSIAALRSESKEAFDACLQAYCDRFQPADPVELGLIEEMVAASWHLRRAFAIETNMLDIEMDACNTAPTELERLTQSFGNLASNPKLALLHRYQSRLHHMHSRLLRDFVILRSAIPAPAPNPEPAIDLDPAPFPPAQTAPEPAATPPLPNEPKTPLSLNKSRNRARCPRPPIAVVFRRLHHKTRTSTGSLAQNLDVTRLQIGPG